MSYTNGDKNRNAIYAYLLTYYATNKRPPPLKQIGAAVGLSTEGTRYHMDGLALAGKLRKFTVGTTGKSCKYKLEETP